MLILLLLAGFSTTTTASYILSSNIPTDISSCQEAVFELMLTNPGPGAQAAGSLQYCLPEGLRFVQISGLGLLDLSDLRCPVFNLPALAANESLNFQLRVQVGCFDTDQGDLRDTLRIISGGLAEPLLLSNNYNVRIPVLTLHPGQNWNYTGAVGEEFTRTFIFRNDGFGAALYLYLIDSFSLAGLELVQTTGTLNGDTLIITGTELGPNSSLGHLDSVTITQTFRITACSGQAQIVSYGWACPDGEICTPQRLDQYQISGANSPAPALVASLENPFQTPVPCEPQTLEIRVENTGNSPALHIDWLQGLSLSGATSGDASMKLNCFPISNFQIGGVSLSDSSGNNPDIPYVIRLSALLSDPDGPDGLSDEDGDGQFDDLAPGSSFVVQCAVALEPDCKPCNGLQSPYFLNTQFQYTNTCGGTQTSDLSSGIALRPSFEQNIITEDHPFLLDAGTTYNFQYTLDASAAGLLDLCPNDSIILEFALPGVLSLPANFQALFDSAAVPFWTVNDTFLYLLLPDVKGELVLPVLPLCPPDIDDSAICGPPFAPRTYQLAATLRWFCGNGCAEAFELVCLDGEHFTIDCPRPDDSTQQHGIFADTLWIQRISRGFVDNERSAQISPATPGWKTDIGIPYDTVQLVATARFEGNVGDLFDSAQVQLYYWTGVQPYFLPLSASLILEDAETGLSFICPNVTLEYRLLNGYHIWELDLLPLLEPGGCFFGNNVHFSPGDRLTLDMQARLTEAWPFLEVEELKDLRVRFPYVYHGDSLLCETKNAPFRGINPEYDYSVGLLFPDTVCQDLGVEITFFQGKSGRIEEDLFPNEIRPLNVYDTILVQLATGYVYQAGSASWTYELGDGAVNAPVPTQLPLADPQALVLPGGEAALLFLRPAGLPVTDYYEGRATAVLSFRTQVLCPPDTTRFPVKITAHSLLATFDSANVQISPTGSGPPDFNELVLVTFSPLSSARTPRWIVEYCNSGPSFTIETPQIFVENGQSVQLVSAQDVTDPALPQALNFAVIDGLHSVIDGLGLEPNSCRTIELTGLIGDCEPDTLQILPGFQCAAADTPCVFAHPLSLYFVPKVSIAQINVSSSPDTAAPLCQPLDYVLKIVNVGDGFMYDIEIGLQLPAAGQSLAPGSSAIEYDGQLVPLPDPVLGPDGYVWSLDFSQLPFGLESLPGILFVQANALLLHFQLETDCEYVDGTRFLYSCSWQDACGGAKKTSPFVAPPLQIMGAPTTTNAYQITLELDNPASFCAENSFRLRIVNPGDLGPTTASEKVRIVFPNTFFYVPGSVQGLHNGPLGAPAILPFGDETYLSFDLLSGVVAGDSIVFSFRMVKGDSLSGCQTTDDFLVQMTKTANIDCGNSSCAIDFVLLEEPFSAFLKKPDFALSGLSGTGLPLDAGLEDWQLEFEIGNISNIPGGAALQLEIRLDENQNAQLDAMDPLLQTFIVDVEGLAPGAKQAVTQNVEVAATTGCSGIWVLLVDTLCSCTLDSVFVPFVRLKNGGGDQLICAGLAVDLGFVPLNAAVYEWIPASAYLSNPSAANPEYLYTGPFDQTFQFSETLVLKTTRSQGCISFDTITLTTRQVLLMLTPSPVLCSGDSTGSVQAVVQGALDPLVYAWSPGASQGPQLNQVPAGNYGLTVTDADGCADTAMVEVLEPLPLGLQVTVSDYNGYGVSCAGASDGQLEVLPAGGIGGYQFTWLPSGSGPLLTGLPAGDYSVTLTDANACSLSLDVNLAEPDTLLMALSVTHEICPDAANGSIAVSVQGGVAPYSSGGQQVGASFSLDNLGAGAYTVLLTDANGCAFQAEVLVQLQASTFSINTDSVSCFGGTDGYAEITGLGFPLFSFSWSDGGSAASVNGPAGTYTCTVTDGLACSYVLETQIGQPAVLAATAVVQPVACYGDSTGQLALQGTGGVAPYRFFQNGQVVGALVDSLPAGFYTFELEDANGCQAQLDVPLEQAPELTQLLTVTDAFCFNSYTGQINAAGSGGTPPYLFSWSTGTSGALLDSVPAGNYSLTLVDAAGCTRIDTALVGQPEPYLPVFEVLEQPCVDQRNGSLEVSALPAGTRYRLNSGPFQSNPVFTGLGGGNQVLELEDSLGCRFEFEYFLPSYPEMLGILLADTVLHLGDSAWLRVQLASGISPGTVSYQWIAPIAPLSACDTCASLWVRPYESVYYTVRFSSLSGCQSESRVLVQVVQDSVYAPNVIWADADLESNRFFTLYGRSEAIREIRFLKIFDRWGGLIFERQSFAPNDHTLGWDGRFRSEILPPAVFVWYAEIEFIDGRLLQIKGDITLLR